MRLLVSAIALVMLSGAPVASAQDGRHELQLGLEAARSGNWSQARDHFQRAYDSTDRAAILVNLAGAQRQLGNLVEAAQTYQRFLDEAEGDDREHIPTAQSALADVQRIIPRLQIRHTGTASGDVYVDGRAITRNQLATDVLVNPGRHQVELRDRNRVLASREVHAREGSVEHVELRPIDLSVAPSVSDRAPEDTSRSPWLWVGIGLGVAAAAGAVTAVILTTGNSPDPYMGNVGPGNFEVP